MTRLVIGILALIFAAQGVQAQTVSIGTNPQGSLAYATGAGVAKVAIEAAGVNMRVVPQGGPVVTLPLANNAELDFTISNVAASSFAVLGKEMFKGRKQENIRLVAVLFPLYGGFYVRNDSGIKTLSDLKGKRIPSKYTKQKIVGLNSLSVLNTVGLSYKDVVGVPVPNGVRGVRDFMEGKNDAAYFSLTSGITRQAHAAVGGIRVLSMENTPEALAALRSIVPAGSIATLQPAKLYPGVMKPTHVFQASFVVNASTKTPDDVVYKVVKALHANKQKLIGSHGMFKQFDPGKMHVDLGVPYHPGAARFYKEMGL